jgi:hypothetical protein
VEGIHGDIPWFLQDLRPMGFLGRAFAREHGPALGLSADPRLWSADATLTALLSHGDDGPGNLLLGEGAMTKVQARRLSPAPSIPERAREKEYPLLAEAALRDGVATSSAAGEQPKFTGCIATSKGGPRHVLVKFSPPATTPAGRRWADLLRCEHLALELLRSTAIGAGESEFLFAADRAFLEVKRFDRIGERGRRGLVSLFSLDSELYGKLDTWVLAGRRLRGDGWLSDGDEHRLSVAWWFGDLIQNTDRHFGNVSLFLEAARPLELAPIYDMLPMGLTPAPSGELVPREFSIQPPPPEAFSHWVEACDLAIAFWRRVLADDFVSKPFKTLVKGQPQAIADARRRLS